MDAGKNEGDAPAAPQHPEKKEDHGELIAAVEDALFSEVALAKWNTLTTLVRKAERHDLFSTNFSEWMAHMEQRQELDVKRTKGAYDVEYL
ncbi:hypothetical protein L596_028696 [Steinernema carpocapsae]|uniref:Uncharacterized protein n=1 Tax=Steinernema carpocapsae TaxID=34508 RepID=A0A4U5LZ47_STECR|nr:hypothetical protein L596_028696 [Steinernema carpocapsae]